jgi:ABC-2 type transport system ATP-binding protein
MTADDIVISVRELKRAYGSLLSNQSEKLAVAGISFEVNRGEIFGILGPNGAGKTTTIKMLATLLTPTSGKAEVLGLDVADERNIKAIRRRINVVSGGERGLYYRLTGRQNLEFFSDLYSIPRRDQKPLIDRLLKLVDLTEAGDTRVEDYSRGMKQRIHIARSLINDPDILFLDEPTIGLDPEMSKNVRRLVRKLSDKGTTVILTTHYMFEAEELCDRMIIISKGTVVGRGTVKEIKDLISDASAIRIVTDSDPSGALSETDASVEKMLDGHYVVHAVSRSDDDLRRYEDMVRPFGIRSAGIENPTLEDAYLALTRRSGE